jgi:hypothetical protein
VIGKRQSAVPAERDTDGPLLPGIAAGDDDHLWFTEYLGNKIGAVGPSLLSLG